MKNVNEAYIFDCDGTITNPDKRKIVNPEMTKNLVNKLSNNVPIGIVSGRALPWLMEKVINELIKYIRTNNLDEKILDNLFASGEFGGGRITFENGQPIQSINPEIRVDSKFIKEASKATQQFSDFVFIDKEKQTQLTAEMNQGLTIDNFQKKRSEISDVYRKLVGKYRLTDKLEVHEDRIAINIKNKDANKKYAARQFVDWLKQKRISIKKFIAFGDSPSDLEIGDELKNQGFSFDFIYVGDPREIKPEIDFTPIFTLTKFGKELDAGTLEFLKSE